MQSSFPRIGLHLSPRDSVIRLAYQFTSSVYYDIIRHEGSSSFVGNTIELVPKGFNKAVGIAAVIRLFDIPWENTVVFGDSNNDLAMFEYAATKVAMGNASPKIKELADYVTSDMFHYGIRDGLRYLKLI